MNARHHNTRRSFLRWCAAGGVAMLNPVRLRAGDAEQNPQLAGALMKVDGRARVPAPDAFTQVLPLDGKDWRIAVDAENRGSQRGWGAAAPPEGKPAQVPGVIQDVFPNYHGVAWYWRDFVAPKSPGGACRYLLRFLAVDYLAEVWLNGVRIGGHEGGETPFVLDVTHAIQPAQTNRLAVRVLNPTNEPIDGYTLRETPAAYKMYPVQSNSVYNSGGIVDSVELLVTPLVRIEDLHLLPDWQTGRIQVRANLRNAGSSSRPCWLQVTVAPATGGESVAGGTYRCEVPPGDTLLETGLAVERHRLWELADPFLYRITASLLEDDTRFADERSARCGFRDFRFESGYFRFNGRRFFLHGMVCQAHYPAVYTVPGDRAMLQRDVVHLKALGFNVCRLTFGGSLARQLDLFDELGILVYHEHYGSDMFYGSGILPKPPDFGVMKGRFTRSVEEIVRRGRNHPSVVVWGLLNETGHKELLAHATATLPLVRALDPTRLVVLNSGGGAHSLMSNPHTDCWRTAFSDEHISLWGEDGPVQAWLAEHGVRASRFDAGATAPDAVILALGKAPAPGGEQAFSALTQHIRRGATAVFLDPRVFAEGKDATRWLPLVGKGRLESLGLVGGYYRPDDWAKRHPIFEGLPAGSIMDYAFYRDLISADGFTGLEPPEEAVCGAVRVSGGSLQRDYAFGLHISVHRLGAGRFILNNLHIRETLGKVPAAERLLRNLLRYAASARRPP